MAKMKDINPSIGSKISTMVTDEPKQPVPSGQRDAAGLTNALKQMGSKPIAQEVKTNAGIVGKGTGVFGSNKGGNVSNKSTGNTGNARNALGAFGGAIYGVANGSSSNTPSAYQQNLQNNQPKIPTLRSAFSDIYKANKTNPTGAQEAMGMLYQLMQDPTSAYYAPYSKPTNQAIGNLEAMGIDCSNIDENWLKQNSWLKQYYTYSSTTNAPTAPGKKASAYEKAAYQYWQIEKAYGDTMNAQKEWAALQDELKYKANNPNRTETDEEIIKGIDWSKYKTLQKMTDSLTPGSGVAIVELNTGIDFSNDAMYAVLWAAQNDGGTGNIYRDMANSYDGVGNVWQGDDVKREWLKASSDNYAPYNAGMTLKDAGIYFGRYDFDQQWLDENRWMLDSTDETQRKYYLAVQEAEKNTQAAEAELELLRTSMDKWMANNPNAKPEQEEKHLQKLLDSGKFKTLVKMQDSIESGDKDDLISTTRAIDWKKENMNAYYQGQLEANAKKQTGTQYVEDQTSDETKTSVPTTTKKPEDIESLDELEDEIKRLERLNDNGRVSSSFIIGGSFTPDVLSKDFIERKQRHDREIIDAEYGEGKYDEIINRLAEGTGSPHAGLAAFPGTEEAASEETKPEEPEAPEQAAPEQAIPEQTAPEEREPATVESVRNGQIVESIRSMYFTDQNREVQKQQDRTLAEGSALLDDQMTDTEQNVFGSTSAETEAAVQYWRGTDTGTLLDKNTATTARTYAGNMANTKGNMASYAKATSKIVDVRNAIEELENSISGTQDEVDTLNKLRNYMPTWLIQAETVINGENVNFNDHMNALRSIYDTVTNGERENDDNWYNLATEWAEYLFDQGRKEITAAYEHDDKNGRLRNLRLAEIDLQNTIDENRDAYKTYDEQNLWFETTIAAYQAEGKDTSELMLAKSVSNYLGDLAVYEPTWEKLGYYQDLAADGVAKEGIEATHEQKAMQLDNAKFIKEYIELNGIEVSEDILNNLNRRIAALEYDELDYQYYMLQFEPDFEEYAEKGFPVYMAINGDTRLIDEMNEQELKTSAYLAAKSLESKNIEIDPKKLANLSYSIDDLKPAWDYFYHLSDDNYGTLNNRYRKKTEEGAAEEVKSGFFGGTWANIKAILGSPVEAWAGFGYIIDRAISGLEYNPNNVALSQGHYSAKVNEETVKSINECCGGADKPWAQAVNGLYEIIYNRGRSAMNAAVFGFFGPESEVLDIVKETVGAIPMAIGAASMAIADAKDNGASDGQAYAIGLATFLAEDLSEGFTYGNIKEAFGGAEVTPRTIKEYLKNWLTKSGVEEMFGESANDIIENVADRYIMKELSDHTKRVKANKEALKEQYPWLTDAEIEEQAEYLTGMDELAGVMHTAIISYLSPGLDVAGKPFQNAHARMNFYRQEAQRQQEQGNDVSMWEVRKEYKDAQKKAKEAKKGSGSKKDKGTNGTKSTKKAAKTIQLEENPFGSYTKQSDEESSLPVYPGITSKYEPEGRVTFTPASEGENGITIAPYAPAINVGKDVGIINSVQNANAATQTAAIGEVLQTEGGGQQESDMANAAAASVNSLFAGAQGSAMDSVKTIIAGAHSGGSNEDLVKAAVRNAALSASSQARQVINSEEFQNATPEQKAAMLESTIETDSQNTTVRDEAAKSVLEWRTAKAEAGVIATGQMSIDQARTAEQQAAAAADATRNVRKQVALAQKEEATAANAAAIASREAIENPSDENTNAAIQATNRLKAASDEVKNKAMGIAPAEAKQRTAEENAQRVKAETMADVRQMAATAVAQEDQARAEAQAQAEAEAQQRAVAEAQQKIAEEETGNAMIAARENFIKEYMAAHPEATEEDIPKLREMFESTMAESNVPLAAARDENGNLTEEAKRNRNAMLKSIGDKFGITIEFGDVRTEEEKKQGRKLADSEVPNGFYDPDTHRIVLNEDISTERAVYFVLEHELTHLAENSDMYYKPLANKLISMAYGENGTDYDSAIANLKKNNGMPSNVLEADLVARKQAYDKYFGRDVGYEYALQELVADKMGELFLTSDDEKRQDLVNRLVAEEPSMARRFLNSIKTFIKQALGMKGAWLSNAQKTVDLLETALKDAQENPKPAQPVTNWQQPIRASSTVMGKTTVVKMADGTIRRFKQNSDALARDISRSYATGTGIPAVSSAIQGIRNSVIAGNDGDAITQTLDLAQQIARNAGLSRQTRAASPLAQAMNGYFGSNIILGKAEGESIARTYGSIAKANKILADAGVKARMTVNPNAVGTALDEIYSGDQYNSDPAKRDLQLALGENDTPQMEDVLAMLDHSFVGQHEAYLNRYNDGRGTTEQELAQEIFDRLIDDVFDSEEVVRGAAVPITDRNGNETAAEELRGGTIAIDSRKYNLQTFNEEEQARVRQALMNVKGPNGKPLYTKTQVTKYLKDATDIAAAIAADKARLDFEANPAQKYLKPNNDYYFTLDASTLCAKRLLYQGTFDYVQHALPDEVFTPEDLIDLVNIMADMGYETPCGICYVESRRRWLDTYAQEFLDRIQEDPDGFIEKRFKKASDEEKAALRERFAGEMPSIDDLTTSDGLEKLRTKDPLMHKAFVTAMNAKGTANPKVVQLRTAYNGDISRLTEKDIQKVKDIGGLRIQSFSDFETPHLLDTVQAVLDMASAKLTSQAYTKVPNFAWVFGDTGIKINLSLIGKGTGLDADGNLVFDNVEGMNFDEAMRLRDRYSKNVGTILVGINDEHIIAAMADPRIDFIIPFHKSGWSESELKGMRTLRNYSDYTDSQNEKKIRGRNKTNDGYDTIPGKESKLVNFQPVGKNGYWNFKKDGEWNARKYLQMCAKDGRVPKFSQFLVDNGDGSFSLPEGDDKRSKAIREGYWKTLIDFKMYDNDGKGAEQTVVTPNINMDQATRVLEEHQLGRQMPDRDGKKGAFIPMESNNSVPVAKEAAEEYIKRIREKRRGTGPSGPLDTLEATPDTGIDVMKLGKSKLRTGETTPVANTAAIASGVDMIPGAADGVTDENAQRQTAMAIDAETGETVERRLSLPNAEAINLNYTTEDGEPATNDAVEKSDVRVKYSLRTEEPPKKTIVCYKAFYVRDGKLYPPMVSNNTNEEDMQTVKKATTGTMKGLETPVGVWLDADVGGIAVDENGVPRRTKKTGRLQVQNAKSGGSATLAFRPGWHLGEWPDATQFYKTDPVTGKERSVMPDDLVFAECEIAADIDYQLEALELGVTEKGGFNRTQAGLPRVPKDGYYKYRTNANPKEAPWYISGAMKVSRILTDEECREICAKHGVEPAERVSHKDIDLEKFGLKAGEVTPTENLERFAKNQASIDNDALLENALNDPQYAGAYTRRRLNFDDPTLIKEFDIDRISPEQVQKYRADYDAETGETETIKYSLPDGEQNAIYVKDGHKENGESVDFINLMLDGIKKGETRTHKNLSRKQWLGLAKDGQVYGRVRFGEPFEITKDSPEYADAMIAGTEYDLKDGESKYYYPIVEMEDFRDNPKKIVRPGNYAQYRYSLPSDAPYMAAVERGETSMASKYIREQAKEAGYTEEVYHGTADFGFTQFNDGTIFVSYNPETARTYATGRNDGTISSSTGRDRISRALQAMRDEGGDVVDLKYNSDTGLYEYTENTAYGPITGELTELDINNYAGRNLSGTYHLYARPGRQLVIDGDGAMWDEIIAPMVSERPVSTNEIAEWAKSNGYDSVRINRIYDNGENSTGREIGDVGIFFNPNDVKSADTVTYDDDGNIIPPSERFAKKTNDIRYSLPSDDVLRQQIRQYIATNSLSTRVNAAENAWQDTHQTPPEIPVNRQPQRQFGHQTSQNSEALHQRVMDYLYTHSDYTPESNREQIDRAIDWVRNQSNDQDPDGYRNALNEVLADNFDYRSADGQARMLTVMSMAALKADSGDRSALNDELRLADAYNKQGTDLGRALQARKIFRMMTPVGRISYVQQMEDDINRDYARRGKDTRVHLSEWVKQAAGNARTEEEFLEVRRRAAKELADQMPLNWKDRLRGWRMLSMLGNPRTHFRNFVGNMLFAPVVSIKNKMGAVVEIATRQKDRTKTLAPILSSEVRQFARQDAKAMKNELTGESKYNEGDLIQRERKAFSGILQRLSDWNSKALEGEDWFFLKGHYRRALGGWIQANGYTVEQLRNNPSLLNKGREYAIREAQKATYRDFSKIASQLNKISREGGVGGFLVDAALPFKKTPANILKRGLEYSPLGVAKALTADLYHLHQYLKYQKAKPFTDKWSSTMPEKAISPTQFIDNLCSGLTGTAIMAIGALLGHMGVASGGLDDDDDEFEKEKGGQEYAIKLPTAKLLGEDITFTLDWAAPMSMPFFVGVEIQEQLCGKEGWDIEEVLNALGGITEPVFNLSMLDGINSLFRTSQNDDTNTITQIGAKIGANYLTSFVPSALGAATRSLFDDTQRKVFVKSGEGSGVLGTMRYAREQVENKIPGVSKSNIPMRDVWGNQKSDGLAERILENFVLPGYVNRYREDPVTTELERLYKDTKNPKMIPSEPGKTVYHNKENYKLSAEEWDTYKTERGQAAYNGLTELFNSDVYQRADDEARAKMVEEVWDYANDVGKSAIFPDYEKKYGKNPVQKVTKDGMVSYYNDEMLKALDSRDYEAYATMVEGLREYGVSDTDIKSKIAGKWRDKYKEAYKNGDFETMIEIEEMLDETDFIFDVASWEEQVDKKREEEELEELGLI